MNHSPRKPMADREDLVTGPNAVSSLLENHPERIHRIVLLQGSESRRLHLLQNLAKKKKIHCQQVEAKVLDRLSTNHQGVVAHVHQRDLDTWETLEFSLKHTTDKSLVVIPSDVEDPRNLGACIRSAYALGANAMLLPARGSCGLTSACSKAAAGAMEKLSICRPSSLEAAIQELKDVGYTVYALEDLPESVNLQSYSEFSDKSIWITGGEDKGIPPYLLKLSDQIFRIPMIEEAHSFNTSVALSLGLYEWRRVKGF
jgi:23S rRNA (guanosine2251-2'-O)-methyltransferase